jgi:hypothetical protein
VEFKALLYVPSILPYELARSMFDDTSRPIKLYVKRVFINDKVRGSYGVKPRTYVSGLTCIIPLVCPAVL